MLLPMSTDAHGRSTTAPLTFSDSNVAAPSHAERARTLVAAQVTGSLATLSIEPAGYPYASFTTFALAHNQPLFLISRIAEHTRNLAADPRASLLVHETGNADPLANGRVTLLGRGTKLARGDIAVREAFLAVHPGAAYYVDYEDFDFWRLQLEAVRYIGGYGRMSWVGADDFRRATVDPLFRSATQILEHMNADHAPALKVYARAFTGAFDAEAATMTAIDRHGFELTVTTPRGIGPARIAFDEPLISAENARATLIALLRAGEAKLAATG
jgi:putative heme iron utilization protein